MAPCTSRFVTTSRATIIVETAYQPDPALWEPDLKDPQEKPMKCIVCHHGETRPGTTTVTFHRDSQTVVVNEVLATFVRTVARRTSRRASRYSCSRSRPRRARRGPRFSYATLHRPRPETSGAPKDLEPKSLNWSRKLALLATNTMGWPLHVAVNVTAASTPTGQPRDGTDFRSRSYP